jgi:hypothetical protein
MTEIHPANADQAAYWNGQAGQHWTEREEAQGRVVAAITELQFEVAAIALNITLTLGHDHSLDKTPAEGARSKA